MPSVNFLDEFGSSEESTGLAEQTIKTGVRIDSCYPLCMTALWKYTH